MWEGEFSPLSRKLSVYIILSGAAGTFVESSHDMTSSNYCIRAPNTLTIKGFYTFELLPVFQFNCVFIMISTMILNISDSLQSCQDNFIQCCGAVYIWITLETQQSHNEE